MSSGERANLVELRDSTDIEKNGELSTKKAESGAESDGKSYGLTF